MRQMTRTNNELHKRWENETTNLTESEYSQAGRCRILRDANSDLEDQ